MNARWPIESAESPDTECIDKLIKIIPTFDTPK